MECLLTDKICPSSNKKCKSCKLEDCRQTFSILEEEEKMLFETEKSKFDKELNKEYPECLNCPFLRIEDLEKRKVRCFYKVKEKCILKSR